MISQAIYENYLNILNDDVLNLSVLIFLLGVIISFVSVLGLLGAVHNSITIISIYIFTVVITIIIQLVLGLSYYYHMDLVILDTLFNYTCFLSGSPIYAKKTDLRFDEIHSSWIPWSYRDLECGAT